MIVELKRAALTSAMRAAWFLIYQGEAVRAQLEIWESTIDAQRGFVLHTVWRLMTLSERVIARGEALEAWVEQTSQALRVDITDVLVPLTRG